MFRIALYDYYVIIIIYVAVARSAYNLSSIVSKFKLNNEYNIPNTSKFLYKKSPSYDEIVLRPTFYT